MSYNDLAELLRVFNFLAARNPGKKKKIKSLAAYLEVTEKSLKSFLKEAFQSDYLNHDNALLIEDDETVSFDPRWLKLPVLAFTPEEKALLRRELGEKGDELLRLFAVQEERTDEEEMQRFIRSYFYRYPAIGELRGEMEKFFVDLAHAIKQRRVVVLRYQNQRGEEEEYRANPVRLVYYTAFGRWYLLAYWPEVEPPVLLYRLDRIREVKITKEEASYPSDLKVKEYFRRRWGMDGGKRVKVKVRFFPEAGVVEKAERELKARGFTGFRREEDGSLLWEEEVEGYHDLKMWLRSFGSSAVVLEPPELRREMVENIRRLLAMYGVAENTNRPEPEGER